MSTGAVLSAHKKQTTERDSHLAGKENGSVIFNSCQGKNELRRQLTLVVTEKEEAKLHANVTKSRITAFRV
ncbi:hypothetical protein TNIN_342061, partial [Trichonephila inaurata madagascariensis]